MEEPTTTPPLNGTPAAFFDVDGTLGSSNVVLAYLDYRIRGAPFYRRWATRLLLLLRLPYYLLLDTVNRDWFNITFFLNYARVGEKELELWATGAGELYYQPRLFPEALEALREHRAQGHHIILVSGGIEPVLRPLARLLEVDTLVAAEPEVRDSRLTGRLLHGPMSGQNKAKALRRLRDTLGIDLEQSYAYGDNYSDQPFLESVGHSVAVNPDRRLRRLAKSRGWPIRSWRHR